MNKDRRARIAGANDEARRALELIQEAKSILEGVRDTLQEATDEEWEYFDNMPESLQGGEKGEKAQEAIDTLESAIDCIESEIDNIDGVL